MIELKNLRLPLQADEKTIKSLAAKKLRLSTEKILSVRFLKKSIDARKKTDIFYAVSLGVEVKDRESSVLKNAKNPDASLYKEPSLYFPAVHRHIRGPRPVICGADPAGLFAALTLSYAGLRPILLERGSDADTRQKEIALFSQTGFLDPNSNVQFGEGGAGMFSDGKLTTNIHDPRCRTVLKTFVQCGAPEEILYLAKPHLGTDRLPGIIKALRQKILSLGGDVRFHTQLTDLHIKNQRLSAISVFSNGITQELETNCLILAAGHSARDIFMLLKQKAIRMEQKAFSIGVRIEHDQAKISRIQYGAFAGQLGAADYKLSCHLPSGRGVYSFCMCPGGEIVAAASEPGHLVVNGMSRFARSGKNANAAILCSVLPEDFPENDVLAGIEFQKKYERAAFLAGGSNFQAPAQLLADFMQARPLAGPASVLPSYPLGVKWTDLSVCLPGFACDALKEAFPLLDKKMTGFYDPEAVLTGIESRSSSPVRILRDETLQASVKGIYPCGEGAGYAGGIMSAAVDGIKTAEAIAAGWEGE